MTTNTHAENLHFTTSHIHSPQRRASVIGQRPSPGARLVPAVVGALTVALIAVLLALTGILTKAMSMSETLWIAGIMWLSILALALLGKHVAVKLPAHLAQMAARRRVRKQDARMQKELDSCARLDKRVLAELRVMQDVSEWKSEH